MRNRKKKKKKNREREKGLRSEIFFEFYVIEKEKKTFFFKVF
jgi:hypothetical protein